MFLRSKSDPPSSVNLTSWFPVFSLRVVGYILILLAAIDAVDSLIPPEFMNPNWEFATIGQFVERSPVSLIGLVFVFHRGKRFRRPLERSLLKPLCTLAIVVGCLYCLTVPLTLGDGIRLQEQAVAQAEQTKAQQLAQLKTLKTSLSKASVAQLQRVADTLNPQKSLNFPNSEQSLRTELLSQVRTAGDTAVQQSLASVQKQRFRLRKTVAKWVIGALVSGVGFIYLGYASWQFV
jgi:transcriptional antiterminator Rof (Rho-off)